MLFEKKTKCFNKTLQELDQNLECFHMSSSPIKYRPKIAILSQKNSGFCIFSLPKFCPPTQNKPIAMIVNSVFSKSGKGLNSIFKKIKQKNRTKMSQSTSQETKLQTGLKAGEISGRASKKAQQIT